MREFPSPEDTRATFCQFDARVDTMLFLAFVAVRCIQRANVSFYFDVPNLITA